MDSTLAVEEDTTASVRARNRAKAAAYRRRSGIPERRKGRDPEVVAAWNARRNAKRRTGKQKYAMTHEERLAWRREHEKAANRLRAKAKRRANPEAVRAAEREKRRQWYAANLEKARAKAIRDAHRRRARLRGNDVRTVTQHDLDRQTRRQQGCCSWCGDARPLTIDHVIPIARGGRHAVGNIVMACESCNKGRCDRLPIEWRAARAVRELVAA